MDVSKRVRFVDIYEDLGKSLTKWLLSDQRAINLTVEKIQWKAKQFAKELEIDDFEDTEWCKSFFDKFCESNNTYGKRNVENLIVGVRQTVTSYIEPIGKVPVHAVGCLSNVIISFSERVVYNVVLCCMADGTKLPPMVLTNVPLDLQNHYDEIKLIQKEDPLIFDDSSIIEWLNSVWCIRHNYTYQSNSLMVTNILLSEDVMKLFVAAATNIVVVPGLVENDVHPLEKEIKEEFADVFRREYQKFLKTSRSEYITLSSKNLFRWISLAWHSISSDTVITKFEKLGLFYEEEPTINTCPLNGFDSEKSYADRVTIDTMQKIIHRTLNSESKHKLTKDKSTSSTSCKPIPKRSVLETNRPSVKQISFQQQKDNLLSTINANNDNHNNSIDEMDEIEIVYMKEKEKYKRNNAEIQELKCFMCNLNFESEFDLYVKHNCINEDNDSLESNDIGEISAGRRCCYYCRMKFETDIDLLSHVCDYPF